MPRRQQPAAAGKINSLLIVKIYIRTYKIHFRSLPTRDAELIGTVHILPAPHMQDILFRAKNKMRIPKRFLLLCSATCNTGQDLG